MLSFCIAVALTFSALPDGAPEFLAPEFDLEEVEATNTPGSAEWYLPVERLKLPVTWRITRNGHTVTNSHGRTRISLEPTSGLWPNDEWHGLTVRDWYCGYDIGNADYVRLPGESDPDPQYFKLASLEMFNLTWYTHVGSTNYHYSALACSNDDYYVANLYSGTELYKPQASRFDSIARSALLGSYEAYYERLYYASQAQRNDWEVDDWGETDDPQQFNFNPTNDLVATAPRFHPDYPTNDFENAEDGPLRPIPASRRLTDADNIARLIENVRALFTPKLKVSPVDDEPPPFAILNARQFVFRPHWLTDPRDYPQGDSYGANLWWASTIPPPASSQIVWKSSKEAIQSSTLGLFPWIEEFTPVAELYALGIPFSCYASTLDMLASGDGFSASGWSMYNPCYELIGALKWHDFPEVYQDSWQFDEIDSFNPHGMTVPMFLTNAYPRAAASVPNRSDAYSRYVDVGTDTDVVRRMVPGRLDLVNQLMSVMDRTIMIPSMHITSTNTLTKVENVGNYTGAVIIVEATWNESGYWDLHGMPSSVTVSATPEVIVSNSDEVVNGVRLFINSTRTDTRFSRQSIRHDGGLFIDEGWHGWDDFADPSTNYCASFADGSTSLSVIGMDGETLGYVGIKSDQETETFYFPIIPWAIVSRCYEWSEAESAGRIGVALGPHQPGVGSADRVDGCKYAILDALATETLGYPSRWRSVLGEYGVGELAGILNGHASDCLDLIKGDAASLRPGYASPEDYIPLPGSYTMTFPEGLKPEATGHCHCYGTGYPVGRFITNTVYHATLEVPGETVDASHRGTWYLELTRTDVEHIHYVSNIVDSIGVVRTEESDSYDQQEVTPAEPRYEDRGTTIDSRTIPDQIELVFTNSYPPTVELRGQAVTNMSYRDDFNAYNLEVWHEIEDITWIYDYDHTRDNHKRIDKGYTPYNNPVPIDPVTSNSTTTVELTVTNILPDDSVEWREESHLCKEEVVLAFVRNGNTKAIYDVRTNPFTGETVWTEVGMPMLVGVYDYEFDIAWRGQLSPPVSPDHDAWDESIIFRVMTQVDWLWNYMKLEKEEQ